MTIDNKIARLRSEIEVAEKALKEKVTEVADVDYVHLVQEFGGNLLGSTKDMLEANPIAALLPAQLQEKYGYIFTLVQRVIRVMRRA